MLPQDWLSHVIDVHNDNESAHLDIPTGPNGPLLIENLYPDQLNIALHVLHTLREFMTATSLRDFQPHRSTINGPGGTGKSVLLNTLIATIRTMFKYNNTIKSAGPTGVSAYNANGETLLRLSRQMKQKGKYVPGTLPKKQKEQLIQNYKHLLALIIDERSMLTSKLLGTSTQVIKETIYQGRSAHIEDLIGALPVFILAGDDYQLSGMTQGAIDSLNRSDGGKMTEKG